MALVLQGMGPFSASQLRLVARLHTDGLRPRKVHATSSGALAALYLIALRAGWPAAAVLEVDSELRGCLLWA